MALAPLFPPSHFDVGSRLWLMHCAEGPVPRATAEAVTGFLDRELHPWLLRWPDEFVRITDDVHALAARIIDARAEDISITTNTSSGLVTVAQSFPWTPGDEVLVPLGEFPSNTMCWRALSTRGVSLREVPLWDGHRAGRDAWDSTPPPANVDPEERLIAAIRPSTRVLAVSWVRFQDGLVLDLARLAAACRERDVALVIDGIQGAGTMVPDLRGAHAFSTGGHKGLLAPQGQGFLWTDETFRNRLTPAGSWLSVGEGELFGRAGTDGDTTWRTDGRRLEAGGLPLLMLTGFRESLRMLADEFGVAAIARHVKSLRERFLEGLVQHEAWRDEALRLRALEGRGRLGPIVALNHGARGNNGLTSIVRRGMVDGIFTTVREGYLRIAWHGYHGGDDVDRALAWLAATSS